MLKFASTKWLNSFQVQSPVYWLEKASLYLKENTCDRLHYEQVEQFEIKSLQSLRSNTYCQKNYLRSIALGMSQKKIDKLTPPNGYNQ